MLARLVVGNRSVCITRINLQGAADTAGVPAIFGLGTWVLGNGRVEVLTWINALIDELWNGSPQQQLPLQR